MTQILIHKIINKEEISKAGKPYTKCSILTKDKNGQDLWLNSFGNSTTKSWKDGQTVDLEIYSEEYNGQKRWKFREPAEVNLIAVLGEINAKLDILVANATFNPKTPVMPISSPTDTIHEGIKDKLLIDNTMPIEQLTKTRDITADEIPW